MIHNLSLLTFPSSPHPTRGTPPQTSGLISASPKSQPFSSDAKTQLPDFSQIPKILRARFQRMTLFTPPSFISYLGFYFDICEWRILPSRAWTPALKLQLANPYAKRKVLSLTKPKGKIYKTKSHGHYITQVRWQKSPVCLAIYAEL